MEIVIEEILDLVKKKMHEQGAYERESYKQLVDESIYYFRERGKLTDDDNEDFIERRLMELYPIVRDEMSELPVD